MNARPPTQRSRPATQPVEAHTAERQPSERASAVVEAEIKALDAARSEAEQHLDELETGYAAMLLRDSESEAEEHDRRIAKERRAISRCDLRRPPLEVELSSALSREDAARRAVAAAEAVALRDKFLATLDEGYRLPAARIAKFLLEWDAVQRECSAANIESPAGLLRWRPGRIEPDRVETYEVYVDESGADSLNEFPPGVHTTGPNGPLLDGLPLAQFKRATRTRERTVKGRTIDEFFMTRLRDVVMLPALGLGEVGFWPPHSPARRQPGEPAETTIAGMPPAAI